MKPYALILIAALGLSACNTPGPQVVEPAAAGTVQVTPQDFNMPEGGDCSADIARYRAVQSNDLSMGHVAQSVYNQIKNEITAAEQECTDGHDARARSMIIASKKRHGYPTGL